MSATAASSGNAAAPQAASADPQVAATIDQALSSSSLPGIRWEKVSDVATTLKPVYEREADRLLWFDGSTPSRALAPTLSALSAAADHGLDPADYDAEALAKQMPAVSAADAPPADRARFDLAVSVATVRMLKAVRLGRVDPRTMGWGYDTAAKPFDVAASLETVRSGSSLASVLDGLEPPFVHFSRYREQLKAYRALAASGEPPSIPSLPRGQTKVVPGQSWEGVTAMAARLRTFGDLKDAAPGAGTAYSGALVAAVKTFQERHGLDADGVIGQGTIRAMNVSIAQRVRQLELAMERERWLPELGGHPNVFVNVALFRLWGDDGKGSEPLRMNVVVGKALNHQTPIFVEQMEYVIFRPFWNPPIGITRTEILPKARRDPGYLRRENLEIVATNDDKAPELPATPANLDAVAAGKLVLRQKPGPKNSLGLAKFIFPNDEAVYMHGTPAQELFSRVRRDFSHGCIRLENPAAMAEWVLRDQPEWSTEKIATAMAGDAPIRATLKEKLTVVLFYATVHVNSESVASFVDDIYGHDKSLDTALGKGYPYPVS